MVETSGPVYVLMVHLIIGGLFTLTCFRVKICAGDVDWLRGNASLTSHFPICCSSFQS